MFLHNRNYFKFAISFLVILQIYEYAECASLTGSGKIIGGTPIPIEGVPFLVSLRLKDLERQSFGRGHVCGGTVISQRVILTAAQCFFNYTTTPPEKRLEGNYTVVMGTAQRYTRDTNTLEFNVQELRIHDDFNAITLENDIAAVFVNGQIKWTWPTVSSIPLNTQSEPEGKMCLMSGWGLAEQGKDSETVKRGVVPVMSNSTCHNFYGNSSISRLCAGYSDGDVQFCDGDIGGPLQCSDRLAGIISYSKGCNELSSPGVYTNISYFHDWIVKTNSSFDYDYFKGGAEGLINKSNIFMFIASISSFLVSLLMQKL